MAYQWCIWVIVECLFYLATSLFNKFYVEQSPPKIALLLWGEIYRKGNLVSLRFVESGFVLVQYDCAKLTQISLLVQWFRRSDIFKIKLIAFDSLKCVTAAQSVLLYTIPTQQLWGCSKYLFFQVAWKYFLGLALGYYCSRSYHKGNTHIKVILNLMSCEDIVKTKIVSLNLGHLIIWH